MYIFSLSCKNYFFYLISDMNKYPHDDYSGHKEGTDYLCLN